MYTISENAFEKLKSISKEKPNIIQRVTDLISQGQENVVLHDILLNGEDFEFLLSGN